MNTWIARVVQAGVCLLVSTGALSAADLASVPVMEVPSVDYALVELEDQQRELSGLAPRFAIPNAVLASPETDGLWEVVDEDTSVWRWRVSSPGALSLNLGFTSYCMPEGGALSVRAADLSHVLRPFTAHDNAEHGELWTPVVLSDELMIELTIPTSARGELNLVLGWVNVGYRGFGADDFLKSGSCNVDVVCPEGDGWRDEIPSVAVISTGGSLFCTGFMVNNTAEDQTPYFMTANHCGIYSGNAASLVVYWNYESPTCGQQGGGSLSDWQSGSYFRAAYSASDFTLVELDENPDPTWSVTFAGWNRGGAAPNSAVAIHHPNCDEKSISFEYDGTATTSYLGTSSPGDGTHIRVIDWDVGTTEPGSSGSPLFDPHNRVVGQLHGGYAACGNDLSDWYGKFSVSWIGGGSSSTRLSNWLDPGGTGATTVDTLVPGQSYCGDGTCDPDEDQCKCPDDCGTPPPSEVPNSTCQDGLDNDCDDYADCDDADCAADPACVCDNDGTCEEGEDCNNCSNDCISGGGGGICGNGVCEPDIGEGCLSCPADCNGKQVGANKRQFCCGDGEGTNPVGCEDSRCTAEGWACGESPDPYCCGDGTCAGEEDVCNCYDCGYPDVSEVPGVTCADGIDNDCDGGTDCEDATGDCDSDPACACLARGEPCTLDSECCSNRCHRGACK